MGKAYWKNGALTDAIDPLQRAVSLDPEHVAAHYDLGLAHVRLQRFAEARASFARCTALDPAHVEAHYGLGLIHLQLGQKERAQQLLQKVLALKPDHQRAVAKLAAMAGVP